MNKSVFNLARNFFHFFKLSTPKRMFTINWIEQEEINDCTKEVLTQGYLQATEDKSDRIGGRVLDEMKTRKE